MADLRTQQEAHALHPQSANKMKEALTRFREQYEEGDFEGAEQELGKLAL